MYFKLLFLSELQWNLGIFYGIHLFLVLITFSVNLFDQLVIIICDPNLKG